MSGIARTIFGASYSMIRGARALRRGIGMSAPDQLRVLLFHEVARSEHSAFARQLEAVAQTGDFVTPGEFSAMITGQRPVGGRRVLLTFDDGFASNQVVAEEVLAAMGISALFFVVPSFVGLESIGEAHRFIRERIDPRFGASALPATFRNMRWDDLHALLARGHAIGAHTDTHARLSTLGNPAALQREIVRSADVMTEHLGVAVDHFAFPFGDLVSLTSEALRVAASRFRFVHSGLRGDNAAGVSPLAIRRESVAPTDSVSLLLAYLDGAVDRRYAASRRQLDGWVQAIDPTHV
jgi:peptidoglycan/xylan/chitin deacetylase (PgdA/CDA1 family)